MNITPDTMFHGYGWTLGNHYSFQSEPQYKSQIENSYLHNLLEGRNVAHHLCSGLYSTPNKHLQWGGLHFNSWFQLINGVFIWDIPGIFIYNNSIQPLVWLKL